MNKQILFTVATLFVLSSCLKKNESKCTYTNSTFIAPPAEINILQGWVSANAAGAVKDPSGFFYEITNPGTGAAASVCSNITVKYLGTLSNGVKFDENTTGFTAILGSLVLGWQKGIPLIKSGGSIKLYLPPSMAYGSQDVKDNNGAVVIPGNSILVFTVQLIAVQ